MDMATRIFQVLLTLVLLGGLVVAPFVLINLKEIPKEDFKRDVRKGL